MKSICTGDGIKLSVSLEEGQRGNQTRAESLMQGNSKI